MATHFLFKDATNGVWSYGLLKTVNEVTSIKTKVTLPFGARVKYETEGDDEYITVLSPSLEIRFIERVNVTEIAKNAAFDAYASHAEFYSLTKEAFTGVAGVAHGEFTATLSDTEELAHVGWIQPRLAGGTIKYVTEYGETLIRVFDQKEVSLVKVRKVFSTGTDANLGITVFYE